MLTGMVARPQPTELGLQSQDIASRLKAVRELKNQVIGSSFKKLQHLHLVPLLLDLVGSNSDAELQIQAISTLGSLAYGVEDGVQAIVAANGVQTIVSALESGDQRVVVAAARSLKLLYQVNGDTGAAVTCMEHGTCLHVCTCTPRHASLSVTVMCRKEMGTCIGTW